MVEKDIEQNLNLSLKLHSAMGKPLNFSLRKEAVNLVTLDKLWARRTSLSGKKNKELRLKSDSKSASRFTVGSVKSYRITGV